MRRAAQVLLTAYVELQGNEDTVLPSNKLSSQIPEEAPFWPL